MATERLAPTRNKFELTPREIDVQRGLEDLMGLEPSSREGFLDDLRENNKKLYVDIVKASKDLSMAIEESLQGSK